MPLRGRIKNESQLHSEQQETLLRKGGTLRHEVTWMRKEQDVASVPKTQEGQACLISRKRRSCVGIWQNPVCCQTIAQVASGEWILRRQDGSRREDWSNPHGSESNTGKEGSGGIKSRKTERPFAGDVEGNCPGLHHKPVTKTSCGLGSNQKEKKDSKGEATWSFVGKLRRPLN